MANLGTLVVTLGVDATQLNNITKSLGTTAQKFRTFGYLASAALTAPMVMAGKASLNMAKDYEFAMQKIVGLTGVAQNVVNKWSEEVLKIGPQLAKTPQELADALYFISSSGIKGAEAMNVLKLSAKASASGLGETKDVADLLTSALNAYKGTGLTAAYATDVLVAAVREGKAEASGFSSAMGQIIPIASQLGVSFDQVAGGMAAITLTGSSSSQAAVYLKGVFNSLLKATTQGEAALQKTGNSYVGLRKILGEQGIIPLMQRLRDIQVKYGDELLSDVLPNIRALTGYLSLAGKNFKYNTDLMNRVTNASGSLAKSFAAVSDTIKFKYDAAISQAQVSLISLGKSVAETFLPLLNSLVQKLGGVTNWFNSLSDTQKENRLKWLALIAAMGPASLLISVIGYSLSGLVSTFKILSKVIMSAGKAMDIMGFATLKLSKLTLPNLKQFLIPILEFLGNSGLAAIIGGVGIAVGGATIAVTKYAKKVKELAKEHDLYYTTLVNVNGELKKLKDLTGNDVEAMTKPQVAVAMDQVRAAWVAAETGWKQAEKNKGLGWKINQKENLKQQLEYARQITEYSKLYNDMTNAYLLGNLPEFNKLQKKLVQITTDTTTQIEAVKRLEDAWAEIDLKAFEKLNQGRLNNPAKAFDLFKPISKTNAVSGPDMFGLQLNKMNLTPQSSGTEQRKVMDDLAASLEYINLKESTLNTTLGQNRDLYNSISAQINAYSNALEGYLNIPVQERGLEWSEGIQGVIVNLEKLQLEFDKVERKKQVLSTISNAFVDFASAIGEAFVNAKSGFQSMVSIILSTAQQVISIFLAEAAAALLMHKAIEVPVVGLIAGMIAVSALMAAWGSYTSHINSAAQMASGGTIPQGFPNDSYPAMLSSGETVLPEGLNLGNLSMGDSTFPKEVLIRFENGSLQGYMNYQSRKSNSYR
jgi:TP901 family phage tail tape measure protein